MPEEPTDAEFIDATPARPTSYKCHCPACRNALVAGNFCDWCLRTCVPLLRKSHAAQAPVTQGMADGKAIVDGLRAGAKVIDGIASIAGAVTGKPRRRRLRQ